MPKFLQSMVPPATRDEFKTSWRVMIAATLGQAFSAGAGLYWIGVLIGPLSHHFGWSISAIAGWSLVLTLSRNLASPLTGLLADRFGARIVALIGVPLVGLGFMAVGLCLNALWMLYCGALFIGLADSVWVTYTRAINSWFSAGRGLALGVAFCGAAIASAIGPRILQIVVDTEGWRWGFAAIGAVALLPLPFVYFWLSERRDTAAVTRLAVSPEHGQRMTTVLRRPTFWFFSVANLLYLLYFTGVQFNLIPFLTSSGLDRAAAATQAGLLGVFIFVGKLCAGAIFDRLHAPYVLALLLFLDALAVIALAVFGAGVALGSLMVIGFAHGAAITGKPYCVARFFGQKFFGGISGLVAVLLSLSAFGSWIFSWLREISGSYHLSLYVSSGLGATAALLFLFLGRSPFLADESGPSAPVPDGAAAKPDPVVA
ncbi:MAG: MFS transporter, partial [Lacunisphaera sp.]